MAPINPHKLPRLPRLHICPTQRARFFLPPRLSLLLPALISLEKNGIVGFAAIKSALVIVRVKKLICLRSCRS